MWRIAHNIIQPVTPGAAEAECRCGRRGHVAQFAEHIAGVAKESRERITEFVDFVRKEIGDGKWGEIDRFPPDRDFLTPAAFVEAMRNIGFKRIT